jgi:hypothetical protein
MLFQFVVPMAIITYCYWRILHKVHKDMIGQLSLQLEFLFLGFNWNITYLLVYFK